MISILQKKSANFALASECTRKLVDPNCLRPVHPLRRPSIKGQVGNELDNIKMIDDPLHHWPLQHVSARNISAMTSTLVDPLHLHRPAYDSNGIYRGETNSLLEKSTKARHHRLSTEYARDREMDLSKYLNCLFVWGFEKGNLASSK